MYEFITFTGIIIKMMKVMKVMKVMKLTMRRMLCSSLASLSSKALRSATDAMRGLLRGLAIDEEDERML